MLPPPETAKNQNRSHDLLSFSFFLSSLGFFDQSSAVTRKALLPPVARKFSGGGAFALGFERNCDITPAF